MSAITRGFALLLLLHFTFCTMAQEKNRDMMIRKIFQSLRDRDDKSFFALFPDMPTLKWMAAQFIEKADPAERDRMRKSLEEITDSSMKADIQHDYWQAIKDGEARGVSWAEANMISFKADTSRSKDSGIEIVALDGKIYFRSLGKDYFISYSDVIWFEGKGWYGVSIGSVDRKENENAFPEEGSDPNDDAANARHY